MSEVNPSNGNVMRAVERRDWFTKQEDDGPRVWMRLHLECGHTVERLSNFNDVAKCDTCTKERKQARFACRICGGPRNPRSGAQETVCRTCYNEMDRASRKVTLGGTSKPSAEHEEAGKAHVALAELNALVRKQGRRRQDMRSLWR